ncbi:hypothetical protein L7F22_027537 [Adiantum nelumboides]|nr:hypothetical protein [Adiantum nelumboides]
MNVFSYSTYKKATDQPLQPGISAVKGCNKETTSALGLVNLKASKFRLINDDLYCKGQDQVLRRVPLSCEIQDILFNCHSGVCGGCFSHVITSRKILQAGFVSPSLHRDVRHWCQSCHRFQLAGDRRLTYEPQTPILAHGPFEKWGIDAIGPLPRATSGKLYIIMGVDYMTRWAEATTTSRITAVEVAKFIFEHICCRFGVPLEILPDRGPGFRGDLVGELMKKLKIKRGHSTLYYPQCNGLVEKVNGLKDKELKRGTMVLRYDNRFDNRKDKKFLSRWEGPFLIRKKYSNGSYQLQEINGKLHKTRVNGWRLKPYFQRFDSELWLELPPETKEDEEKSSSFLPCYEDPEKKLEV